MTSALVIERHRCVRVLTWTVNDVGGIQETIYLSAASNMRVLCHAMAAVVLRNRDRSAENAPRRLEIALHGCCRHPTTLGRVSIHTSDADWIPPCRQALGFSPHMRRVTRWSKQFPTDWHYLKRTLVRGNRTSHHSPDFRYTLRTRPGDSVDALLRVLHLPGPTCRGGNIRSVRPGRRRSRRPAVPLFLMSKCFVVLEFFIRRRRFCSGLPCGAVSSKHVRSGS